MAFAESFLVTQTLGLPGGLNFSDTSSGSDPNITERHIFLQKADGTYLVPLGTITNYIVWPISLINFSLAGILDKDYALQIEVDWVSVVTTPLIFSNAFDTTFN